MGDRPAGGDSPKVSVCVVVYNHAKYLEACLRSLVEQVTSFRFEIVVGDDCSTDGSQSIIEQFARQFPGIVRPVLRSQNLGPIGNYMETHRAARGQYVAHMDGDDYALPGKLQRQADRLDADDSLSIVWHRMEFFDDAGRRQDHPRADAPYLEVPITRADLMLFGPFGPHSSTMYRGKNFSLRYAGFDAIDWLFSVELMGDGIGVMMRDVLGAYRIHPAGMSGGAVANRRTRELLRKAQIELLSRFPQYRSVIALRAAVVVLFDLARLDTHFVEAVKVLIVARSVPDVRLVRKLLQFYRYSALPKQFVR